MREVNALSPSPVASGPSVTLDDTPGEALAAEMAAAWARGNCLPAEHYLDGRPELSNPPEPAIRIIFEEVCLRQERGDEVRIEELQRRFPRWSSELSVMLECHRLVQARLGPPLFPSVGETLGDFRLIKELGRSAHARVFLAMQPTLADRNVVLKVTPRQDCEHLSLARLQHTHIIPLHGVHDSPSRNLRAICQPYLGGVSLAHLLDALQNVPPAQRSGRSLVDALDRAGNDIPPVTKGRGPRSALARAAYAEAICWIGACLADALQHAHERGLVHLDLKPSNVLLAADGQPLLLDFHLALHPVAAGQIAPEGMGGTPEYMSPEQRAAYAAARRGLPVPIAVDCRSDVYSLGRMMYIALGGAKETDGSELSRLHRCNPRVSVGLSDVVHRCLAKQADDRYATAADLAADLRRHLASLPLKGVPNRSLLERWGKWRRRRPHALLWTAAVVVLTAGVAAIGAAGGERLTDARNALREGEEQLHRHSYSEAVRTLARGKARVEGWPGCHALVEKLDDALQRAKRASAAGQLHTVTDRLRLLAGADVLSPHDLRALESHCRAAWDPRHLVLHQSGPALEDSAEEQVRADLVDLALLWTDLKRRLASGDAKHRAESLAVLDEVEALCGPSAAVERERETLGASPKREVVSPNRTAWECAALGRSLLHSGDLGRAAEEFARAIDLRPQDFWPHFYQGVCAYRRGRHSEAIAAFSVAVALAPDSPEVYHNRALAHAASGDVASALHDYDKALTLAPTLASSSLNRGVLHYQNGRYSEALADLEQALRHGADPAAGYCNLALVHIARGERTAARENVAQALHIAPGHAQALLLRDRLADEKGSGKKK